MKKPDLFFKSADEQLTEVDKQPYVTPVLKEHGHAKDVTLQTFFGTFSPPASD